MQATNNPQMSTAVSAMAKGSNFIGLLNTVERMHDVQARLHVLSQLPPHIQSALKHGQVLAIGWYPVEWYAELHAAIDLVTGGGPEFARTLGSAATLADFGGMHRLVASMLSTETVFGQAHRLMSLYWRGGTVERVSVTKGRAQLKFDNWAGFSRLVWEDVLGSVEGILTFCGAKDIHARSTPLRQNITAVQLELRWS